MDAIMIDQLCHSLDIIAFSHNKLYDISKTDSLINGMNIGLKFVCVYAPVVKGSCRQDEQLQQVIIKLKFLVLMNKFNQFYEQSKIHEWSHLYIDYALLKRMLKPFLEVVRLQDDQVNLALISYNMYKRKKMPKIKMDDELKQRLKVMDKDFVEFYMREMDKCNQFFILHVQQVEIKLKKLNYNIMILNERRASKNLSKEDMKIVKKNYYILRETTKSLYKEAALLDGFCHMNRQASIKINKQYGEKTFFMEESNRNLKKLKEYQNMLEIYHESHSLAQLMEDLEQIFITQFSREDPKGGIQALKAETKERELTIKNTFYLGAFLGVAVCLFLTVLLHRVELVRYFNPDYDIYFPMFRGLSLFLFYFWLLACNVYIWNKSHINYRQIFRFDTHYSSLAQILKRVSFFTMIFFIVFLLSVYREIYDQTVLDYEKYKDYYISPLGQYIFFAPQFGPLIIWSFIILYLIVPTKKAFNGRGRRYVWRLLWRCLVSAFYPMSFPISWCTDQFVSFVGPLRDVSQTICFYYAYFALNEPNPPQCGNSKTIINGLIIAWFPLILRMIQCGRAGYDKREFFGTDNWYNFLKYLASFVTALFSYTSKFWHPAFYLWIVFAFVSMVYSYYWDVVKDWKFFQPDTKYRFLRRQLAYDWPKFYYSIMIMNIFLRMTWTLSISPDIVHLWNPMFVFIISGLEIFRRFLWNFIRVEKEHVVNMGEFKAVPDAVFPYEVKMKQETVIVQPIRRTASLDLGVNRSERTSSYSPSQLSPSIISQNNQDYYKHRFNELKEQEESKHFNLNIQELMQSEEEVFRSTLGDFQKKMEQRQVDYPDLVRKCKQDAKEIEIYIKKLQKKTEIIPEGEFFLEEENLPKTAKVQPKV